LRDYGVLDFDAGNARRLPLVDTTWQQVLDALSDYKISYTRLFIFFDVFFLGLAQFTDIYTCFFVS